jgi:hypothetical protein
LTPTYSDLSLPVLDLLVARSFADRHTTAITLRALAERFGKSHAHYHCRAHDIEERANPGGESCAGSADAGHDRCEPATASPDYRRYRNAPARRFYAPCA